jgi:hypothetical protein
MLGRCGVGIDGNRIRVGIIGVVRLVRHHCDEEHQRLSSRVGIRRRQAAVRLSQVVISELQDMCCAVCEPRHDRLATPVALCQVVERRV